MKVCSECGITVGELKEMRKRLVKCVVCGVSVCTAFCHEVVTDAETGRPVFLCGACFLLSAMQAAGVLSAESAGD